MRKLEGIQYFCTFRDSRDTTARAAWFDRDNLWWTYDTVFVRLMMPTFTVGHLSTGKRSKAGCGSSASGWECKEPLHLL